MPSDIFPWNAKAWEDQDPSTRKSTGLWTKTKPVDVTLSVAGTAQDLINISSPLPPTVNLATNPSFETGNPPTSYTAVSATLAQSAVVAKFGTNSMRITPSNLIANEGAFWLSPAFAGREASGNSIYFVVSIYVQDNAGSGNNVQIVIADTSGNALATSANVALSATWQRVSTQYLLPAGSTNTQYRVYFQSTAQMATVWYVDGFQPELSQSGVPTAYCDGAQGINYEWDGTAHASTSRRRSDLVVIRGFDLFTNLGAYISFDVDASSTTGMSIPANASWSPSWPVTIRKRISFINEVAAQTPRVRGAVWGTPTGQES